MDANQNQTEGELERVARSSCPAGWSFHGSRCFIFYNSQKTWILAESGFSLLLQQHCLTLGANLASIHSLEEYQFIQEMVKGSSGGFPPTWIGGFDTAQNRLWFWSDGSRFDYQLWNSGEPNNYGGRKPCIEMNYGGWTVKLTQTATGTKK
ncbi:ladderlectin-like [Centroberyx affinis]|uniref:ladderlectin-like n=1 Tax=Centroberyx affinis TaxID=166261 RepID=UPI003A5B9AE5